MNRENCSSDGVIRIRVARIRHPKDRPWIAVIREILTWKPRVIYEVEFIPNDATEPAWRKRTDQEPTAIRRLHLHIQEEDALEQEAIRRFQQGDHNWVTYPYSADPS